MNPTLATILVICLIIITVINIFFAIIFCITFIRIKNIVKNVEKIFGFLGKISSGWAKFAAVILGIMGKLGMNRICQSVRNKKEEKNV